jgi:putative hydrolase of the HAD superfamily
LKKEISTLLQGLASSISSSDDAVVAAFKKLKGAGFKMALLTNIGWTDESKTKTMIHIDTTYFDVIVESCKIAMRKPYSDIYKYTLSQLGLQPEECIFIDDLKTNCVGAEQLGMKAIQVVRGDTETALKELESLTGVSLF